VCRSDKGALDTVASPYTSRNKQKISMADRSLLPVSQFYHARGKLKILFIKYFNTRHYVKVTERGLAGDWKRVQR
jgi:hypothetical protein